MTEKEPVRIISVDDSPDMHEIYQRILVTQPAAAWRMTEAGSPGKHPAPPDSLPTFALDCASQGVEALEKVVQARKAGRPYAVAFVDFRMPPGWDGIETIE